jgi:hypothetical protein
LTSKAWPQCEEVAGLLSSESHRFAEQRGHKRHCPAGSPADRSVSLWGFGPSKPFSHERKVLRRFGKEIVLAGFAAEAQAPMVMADKTELSPAVCAAVLQLGHEVSPV